MIDAPHAFVCYPDYTYVLETLLEMLALSIATAVAASTVLYFLARLFRSPLPYRTTSRTMLTVLAVAYVLSSVMFVYGYCANYLNAGPYFSILLIPTFVAAILLLRRHTTLVKATIWAVVSLSAGYVVAAIIFGKIFFVAGS